MELRNNILYCLLFSLMLELSYFLMKETLIATLPKHRG